MKTTYYPSIRRPFFVFLIVISLLLDSMSISAKSPIKGSQSIETAIASAYEMKKELGLEYVDFEKVTYSDPIIAYDYYNHSVSENAKYIPIKYQERLIGWVINYDNFYQFSTSFVSIINERNTNETGFSFVYSLDSCYLYDGETLLSLCTFNQELPKRSSIENIQDIMDLPISLSKMGNDIIVGFHSSANYLSNSAYVSCGVSYVTQNPYNHLCWAASAACISNYVNGTTKTAVNVVNEYKGYFADSALPVGYEASVLSRINVTGYTSSSVPSDSVIYKNIRNYKPIIATFDASWTHHDTVIYSISITGGYVGVMDPLSGYTTASYSSTAGYQYYNSNYGCTLILDAATCFYWIP